MKKHKKRFFLAYLKRTWFVLNNKQGSNENFFNTQTPRICFRTHVSQSLDEDISNIKPTLKWQNFK